MKSGEQYRSHIATGSGSTNLMMSIHAKQVLLSLHTRWMGQSPFDAVLECEQIGTRGALGWIQVIRLLSPEIEIASLDLLFPPILEYVLVPPQTQSPLTPRSDLALMQSLGYSTWNAAWDLSLWTHPDWLPPAEGLDDDDTSPETQALRTLQHAMNLLDKTRWERVSSGHATP